MEHTNGKLTWANYINEDGTPISSKEQIKALLCKSVDKCDGLYLSGVAGQDERGEVVVAYTGNGPRSPENAHRIEACWNALAGFKTEDIESGIVGEMVEWLRRFASAYAEEGSGRYLLLKQEANEILSRLPAKENSEK